MPKKMPIISECAVTECSYNKSKVCHAMAITVGDGSHPSCDTFFNVAKKGGVDDMAGTVGACKAHDCKYNDAFECSAPNIRVGAHANHADCQTYSQT